MEKFKKEQALKFLKVIFCDLVVQIMQFKVQEDDEKVQQISAEATFIDLAIQALEESSNVGDTGDKTVRVSSEVTCDYLDYKRWGEDYLPVVHNDLFRAMENPIKSLMKIEKIENIDSKVPSVKFKATLDVSVIDKKIADVYASCAMVPPLK